VTAKGVFPLGNAGVTVKPGDQVPAVLDADPGDPGDPDDPAAAAGAGVAIAVLVPVKEPRTLESTIGPAVSIATMSVMFDGSTVIPARPCRNPTTIPDPMVCTVAFRLNGAFVLDAAFSAAPIAQYNTAMATGTSVV
jgi:hypothetical protein